MIVIRLISGLGNQLFQYSVGRQLALKKNCDLKLDLSFFGTQNLRTYTLREYNVKSSIASDEEIKKLAGIYFSDKLEDKIRRKIQNLKPKHKRSYFKEDQWWVYEPELFNTSSNVYLDGYWQHYKYFEQLDKIIFDELTLKEGPHSNVQSILSEIKSNNSSVSVHVRRGDYVSDLAANKLMGLLPVAYYNRAIDYMKQHVKDPVFYFFSDDINWVKDNIKVGVECFYLDGQKDYVDLNLMSNCSHNIIANSSFSWWGAFLNPNPDKIVIAPKKWVVPEEVNSRIQIQFPSWIKL
jgi:hypothetical protein